MSQIDPLHDNPEERLSQALRSLAAGSLSQAPAEVGETLARAFRQRHARRRGRRRAIILATILALSLPALLLLRKREVRTPANMVMQSAAPSPTPIPVSPAPQPVPVQAAKKDAIQRVGVQKKVATASPDDDFLPLRRFDANVQTADMQIMRLELTGRALRQVGAPVSAEMDDRRLLADFVVGFDGTPYAVRLVQRHTY